MSEPRVPEEPIKKHVSYEVALRRGKESEARFRSVVTKAVEERTIPEWFKGMREGTLEEDKIGIDWMVETDKGPIEIQVKSGIKGAQSGRKKARELEARRAVIAVFEKDTDEELLSKVLTQIDELRQTI